MKKVIHKTTAVNPLRKVENTYGFYAREKGKELLKPMLVDLLLPRDLDIIEFMSFLNTEAKVVSVQYNLNKDAASVELRMDLQDIDSFFVNLLDTFSGDTTVRAMVSGFTALHHALDNLELSPTAGFKTTPWMGWNMTIKSDFAETAKNTKLAYTPQTLKEEAPLSLATAEPAHAVATSKEEKPLPPEETESQPLTSQPFDNTGIYELLLHFESFQGNPKDVTDLILQKMPGLCFVQFGDYYRVGLLGSQISKFIEVLVGRTGHQDALNNRVDPHLDELIRQLIVKFQTNKALSLFVLNNKITVKVNTSKKTELASAVDTLTRYLGNDEEYLWGWYCAIKMSAVDAGASLEQAAETAYRFIYTFARVDITKHPLYIEEQLKMKAAQVKTE